MELKQLKYFVAIVEAGSIGKASNKLNIGTSALSQQITKLEDELSTRLLQRSVHGVTPTPSGIAFFKEAQLIIRHMDFAVQVAQSSRLSGQVSIGLPPTISAMLGIPLMQFMTQRYPNIRIELIETLTGNLMHAINSRQLDLAIIFTDDVDKQWSVQALVQEQMYLMSTPEFLYEYQLDDCIKAGSITVDRIKDIPLILPSKKNSIRKALEQQVGSLNVVHEIDGLRLLLDSLIHLNMASIRPGSAYLKQYKDRLGLLKVVSPEIERVNYLVSLTEDHLSPACLAAKVAIKSCIKKLVQEGIWPSAKLLQ